MWIVNSCKNYLSLLIDAGIFAGAVIDHDTTSFRCNSPTISHRQPFIEYDLAMKIAAKLHQGTTGSEPENSSFSFGCTVLKLWNTLEGPNPLICIV